MRKPLNRDVARRSQILAPFQEDGDFYFQRITAKALEQLVAENFADPRDQQNDAPTLGALLAFIKRFPDDIRLSGYATEIHRSDYRVSIETIEFIGEQKSPELQAAWDTIGYTANERDADRLWWD